jgi:inositol phosphorylceramide synthase catalytic subunit
MEKIDPYESLKTKLIILVITLIYLLSESLLFGMKVEHFAIAILYNACIWIRPQVRKFTLAFSTFVVFGIIYDLMKAYPNYLVNSVDIAPIYNFEKSLFGINFYGKVLTLNEFFAAHHNSFLDLLSGFFYINWIPVPIAFGVWLYFRDKEQFLYFSLTFLLVNLFGFCIYYIHPAAPPWYVAKYGFNIHLGTPGEVAGFARFDELIGIKLFGFIYSRNSNVFAALPSLHCAYPVVVLFFAIKNNNPVMKFLFGLFMIGIWFSAIYSEHHYVTDIILGVLCSAFAILVFQKILLRSGWFKKFITKYLQLIS